MPELEHLLGPWRAKYDPSSSRGVPAHISLLVPFRPPELVTEEVIADLMEFFAARSPPVLQFAGVCGFPNAIYLLPEPAEEVRGLIADLVRRYTGTAPYGGTIPLEKMVPHVTVAVLEDREALVSVSDAFCHAVHDRLPISVEVKHAVLFVEGDAGEQQYLLPFESPLVSRQSTEGTQ